MFTCKVCSRKFKTEQGLGGHMSGMHPREREIGEHEAFIETGDETNDDLPVEPTGEDNDDSDETTGEEDGVGAEIRKYLSQGWSFEDLTRKLHFSDKSVRREIAKMESPSGQNTLPVVMKEKEVMSPEALLRVYSNGSLEDRLELRGMMKMRAAMLMVMELCNIQRMTAEADVKRFTPMLEMLKESRSELDAAAARAKDSNVEIAERAAFEVAQGMKGAFSSELQSLRAAIPATPPPPDPMAAMMAEAMKPVFGQLMQTMMKPFMKRQGADPSPQQPQETASSAAGEQTQPAAQPAWVPPNISEHSIDEWEG